MQEDEERIGGAPDQAGTDDRIDKKCEVFLLRLPPHDRSMENMMDEREHRTVTIDGEEVRLTKVTSSGFVDRGGNFRPEGGFLLADRWVKDVDEQPTDNLGQIIPYDSEAQSEREAIIWADTVSAAEVESAMRQVLSVFGSVT